MNNAQIGTRKQDWQSDVDEPVFLQMGQHPKRHLRSDITFNIEGMVKSPRESLHMAEVLHGRNHGSWEIMQLRAITLACCKEKYVGQQMVPSDVAAFLRMP